MCIRDSVSTGSVTEDIDPDSDGLLETSGRLTISDVDAGEAVFVEAASSGLYGNLTIDTVGDWNYAVDNNLAAVQALASGSVITVTLQVSSVDGTTHDVIITINGANDASVIGGDSTGSITEDVDPDGDGLLEVNGSLTISDLDAGEAVFIAATTQGVYGSFAVDTEGSWRYAADNSLASIQSLDTGVSVTDTLTVSSAGGAKHNVMITIAGVDEAAANGDITISWVAPVEREDGTPISMSEIAGYRVYYGTSPGNYTYQVEVADSATMQATLSDLAAGTYYIVVRTYDMDGRESGNSMMVTGTI